MVNTSKGCQAQEIRHYLCTHRQSQMTRRLTEQLKHSAWKFLLMASTHLSPGSMGKSQPAHIVWNMAAQSEHRKLCQFSFCVNIYTVILIRLLIKSSSITWNDGSKNKHNLITLLLCFCPTSDIHTNVTLQDVNASVCHYTVPAHIIRNSCIILHWSDKSNKSVSHTQSCSYELS